MRTTWVKRAIGAALGVVVVVILGTWVYIELIRGDVPERLSLDEHGEQRSGASTATTNAGGLNGRWRVGPGSEAGYRVKEILFGQDAEAVGRTKDVTGEIDIVGTTVRSGSFSVAMATMVSDEARRDNQFRGRIMDVRSHPTATFRLTRPIEVPSVPPDGQKLTVGATGDLTLRGTTKNVTIMLTAERLGGSIRIAGSLPIVFEEWGIPNPSFGPAQTEDRGELEFLLVLSR
jgi:polyisoprenoid-binding protein YceI